MTQEALDSLPGSPTLSYLLLIQGNQFGILFGQEPSSEEGYEQPPQMLY